MNMSCVAHWKSIFAGPVFATKCLFAPWHIANWSKFPAWYHMTFLLTILPAVLVGALLPPRRNKDLNEVYSGPRESLIAAYQKSSQLLPRPVAREYIGNDEIHLRWQ